MNDVLPVRGRAELVVSRDRVGVAGPLVAEELAAAVEVALRAGTGLHEDVLVVVAGLVAEVAQHRAVRLAEAHPQRFPVCVKGFHQIDGDHPVGVADGDPLAGAVAGQQIERQTAVAAPVRVDRQAEVVELVDQPAQRHRGGHELLPGDGVVGVGFAANQRVGQASSARRRVLGRPAPASCSPAARPACSAPRWCRRWSRFRRSAPPSTGSAGAGPRRRRRIGSGHARTVRSSGTPGRRRRAWASSLHGRQNRAVRCGRCRRPTIPTASPLMTGASSVWSRRRSPGTPSNS